MPRINIELTQPEFGFSATDEGGIVVKMDNSKIGGGQGFGISPMQNLLASLGGCSGIDIVSILRKQRQNFTGIRMEIDGEREKGKEPALWQKVHIDFYISGEVEVAKANHAVGLSIDKYCSVAETLRRAGCEITWELFIED
ncbi:MAG: OsmC family protein [Chitinophagaceae bacterium]